MKEKLQSLPCRNLVEENSKQSGSKRKGPEVGAGLARLRRNKEAAMFYLQQRNISVPVSVSKISRD